MASLIGIGLLSAAMLLLQVALTRVFSIAQFYHFAFLVISLALLGFGASGSLLTVQPRLRRREAGPWYALGFALSTLAAYLLVNHFPFDSYSIAWDRGQVLLLVANLLALAVPFVFAGALIAALLSSEATHAGRIYSANLIGSAAGAAGAPLALSLMGSERAILLSVALGLAAALIMAEPGRLRTGATVGGTIMLALMVVLPPILIVQPSPYKRLSQFRLDPDAEIVTTLQNAYARLDIIASRAIHSAQGLSLTYLGDLPPQVGLLVDGDVLYPVASMAAAPPALGQALPAAVAYAIRPAARALVLGSGGNMDPFAALANRAESLTVVEPNRLVYEALTETLRGWAGIAGYPHTEILHSEIRSFAGRAAATYDVVQLSLTDAYRPITSGAFTLTENYTLTVEAFESYLNLLGDDGLLILNRWLQSPPSESLRTLGIILEALGDRDPLQHLIVFRSFQTATFIIRPTPFTPEEVTALLAAIDRLRYDLVLAPEMPAGMINQYAVLESPVYHDLFLELATTPDRAAFYANYDFAIAPPTDDHPFFFHFFRWRQTPEVLQNLGTRWQPFGGSGYFVLLALLAFALAAAAIFILAPVGLRSQFRAAVRAGGKARVLRVLSYFTTIGLAYLFVEVALIQQFILTLGQPTLAIAVVIGALLLASGVGSAYARRFTGRRWLITLAALLALYPFLVEAVAPLILPWALLPRVMAVALLIAPSGLLMGVPFARGITALANRADLVPWAWAVNGSASVISAVLAVILALSWGFTAVLLTGGGLYLVAGMVGEI